MLDRFVERVILDLRKSLHIRLWLTISPPFIAIAANLHRQFDIVRARKKTIWILLFFFFIFTSYEYTQQPYDLNNYDPNN